MAEPKVSYKGLEEPTPSFVAHKQHLVVPLLLTLFFVIASVDATSPTVDHRDGLIRIRRDPTMPNDRSMSAADISDKGTEDSSTHSPLPLSVEVAGDDNNDEIGLLSSCSADEYLDTLSNTCQKCTACGPGTQHGSDEDCGYGQGSEQSCEPCPPNHYQDKTSTIPVECKLCITCDKLANTTRECSPEHNAECGPCQPGYYYWQENNCLSCEQDRTREECRTTLTTPDPTESTSVPPPVVSTTARTFTTSEGPKRNTTHPTVHVPCSVPALTRGLVVTGCTAEGVAAQGDTCTFSCTSGSLRGRSMVTCGSDGMFSPAIPTCGVDRAVLAGAVGGVLGVFIIAALIIVLVCKILKRRQGTDEETGSSGDNRSTDGRSCAVRTRGDEAIQYDALCQVERSQDDQAQSNLSVDPPPVSPPSACSGPSVSGQDAPPARLPREDDALCQVEQSEDDQPPSLRSNLSVDPPPVSPPSACSGPSVSGQNAPPASLPREDDAVPLSGEMAASPEP